MYKRKRILFREVIPMTLPHTVLDLEVCTISNIGFSGSTILTISNKYACTAKIHLPYPTHIPENRHHYNAPKKAALEIGKNKS